jgi:hypothetical protein
MEVVLLWLDELDDLVFSCALLAEPLRKISLDVGFAASLSLVACETSSVALAWATPLAGVAAAGVSVWLLAAMYSTRLQLVAPTSSRAA